MRKKFIIIQIIQTAFMIILFSIATLEKNGIMQREKSFMPFYVISCIVYWLIIDIILIIMMNKNKKEEKKIFRFGLILTIEILLLGIYCGNIDNRIDLIEFTKHCKETVSVVYDIKKDLRTEPAGDGRHRASLRYTYRLEYYVYGMRYTAYFSETHYGPSRKTMSSAESIAEVIEPRYKIGDEFTIYYNTDNPKDYRRNIGYLSNEVLNVFAWIIIGLRGFILGKSIIEYNKENKEKKNLI